jgi:hypothetical protein
MTKAFFKRGKQIAKWADKQGETNMPCNQNCNQNCNQGRSCDCKKDSSGDRAVVIISTLILIAVVSMCWGVWKLFNGSNAQDCAVEVQFGGGVKATYLGTSI